MVFPAATVYGQGLAVDAVVADIDGRYSAVTNGKGVDQDRGFDQVRHESAAFQARVSSAACLKQCDVPRTPLTVLAHFVHHDSIRATGEARPLCQQLPGRDRPDA